MVLNGVQVVRLKCLIQLARIAVNDQEYQLYQSQQGKRLTAPLKMELGERRRAGVITSLQYPGLLNVGNIGVFFL